MLYLNHAGTSWPKPEVVQSAVAATFQGSAIGWSDGFERTRAELASLLGLVDPNRLLLTPGCTAALQLAILAHPWEAGDRVVTSGWEHQAVIGPVRELGKRGVEHVMIPPVGEAPFDLSALRRVLRAKRVRLVVMSAASNVTGVQLPVEEATEVANRHGALMLVDAAQTAGWLGLPAADMVAFAGHKGPQAPWGIGGLWIGRTVTLSVPPPGCDRASPGGSGVPGYCEVGSVDRAALAGLVAGLRWLKAPERAQRLAVARDITAAVAAGLRECSGIVLHGCAPAHARMPTLAVTSDGLSTEKLGQALHDRGIVTSAGFQCAPLAHDRLETRAQGVVRMSVGPMTRESAVDRVLSAVKEVIG